MSSWKDILNNGRSHVLKSKGHQNHRSRLEHSSTAAFPLPNSNCHHPIPTFTPFWAHPLDF